MSFFNYGPSQVSFQMIIALHLLICGAGVGLPWTVALCQLFGHYRKKNFLDKFAAQITDLAIFCGIYLLVANTALAFLLGLSLPTQFGPVLSRLVGPLIGVLLLIALAVGLIIAYAYLRPRMRNAKPKHAAVAIASGSCLIVAVFIGLMALRAALPAFMSSALLPFLSGDQPRSMELIFAVPPGFFLLPVLVELLGLAVTASGAFALAYLHYRRNKDDFGRDYYNFAARTAAAIAAYPVPVVAVAACLALYTVAPGLSQPLYANFKFIMWFTGLVVLALAGTSWAVVVRSQNPLRLKGLMASSLVVLLAGAALLAQAHLSVLAP